MISLKSSHGRYTLHVIGVGRVANSDGVDKSPNVSTVPVLQRRLKRLAKPYDNSGYSCVYFRHKLNLRPLFFDALLVNAQLVNPE